ncbi:MAG: NAD(+)/NADH kinase [Candidatus Cloacimonas sp.]|nr:NAD(+)/NADH kinase [Candidatus Cloacimonadota bacterium]
MKKIGVFANGLNKKRELVPGLVNKFLKRSDVEVFALAENIEWLPPFVQEYKEGKRLDYLLVFGGDGTILRGVDLALKSKAAILGINMGRLGFLSDFSIGECHKYLHLLFEDNYSYINRMLLDVEVHQGREKLYKGYALNDAVIYKGIVSRLIEIRVYNNRNFVLETRCDGMIAASPTGSTAYSLSAGGPILTPEMEALIVAPLCPHVLSVRPMVFPAESELRFKMSNVYNETMLQLDGRNVWPLIDGDNVLVKPSNKKVEFVTLTKKNFYQTLRKKLHMGRL